MKLTPNRQVSVEIKVVTLDAPAGSLASYLGHLICDLLSLSKIKWVVCNIDFLPCGLLFKLLLTFCGVGAPWSLKPRAALWYRREGTGGRGTHSSAGLPCRRNLYKLVSEPYSPT